MTEIRFGILGAARIAPAALVKPARSVARASVVAVAARSREKAEGFSMKYGIPRVHESYESLLDDDEIDAVYVPLPNGLHAEWATAALRAGKHVLCEKPLTNNAAEARHLAAVAEDSGRVLMEAFHYRYHPVGIRMREIAESGELGDLERVEATMCIPLPRFSDIRYQYDLGGGALMDIGCYAVHMARLLGISEPVVTSARATLRNVDIDRAMHAGFAFPGGHTGSVACSMWSRQLLSLSARAVGSAAELHVLNPLGPNAYHRISVRTRGPRKDSSSRVEHLSRRPTYNYQLEAFCAAVLEGAPVFTGPADSIANMSVIDDIYRAAGMRLRGT